MLNWKKKKKKNRFKIKTLRRNQGTYHRFVVLNLRRDFTQILRCVPIHQDFNKIEKAKQYSLWMITEILQKS